jgi:UDP-N-acetylglucosamine transferase subunit ALG13
MIFATVGTEKFPFDRLIKILDEAKREDILEEEVFLQIGSSRYTPGYCMWERYMEYGEIIDFMSKARVVVTHAGVGSTLLCLALDKVPIVFPRSHGFGEHLDDHQIEFTRRMASEDKVIAAYDNLELIKKIKGYENFSASLKHKYRNTKKLTEYLIDLLS